MRTLPESKMLNEIVARQVYLSWFAYSLLILLLLSAGGAALVGPMLVPSVLHPQHLNQMRADQTQALLIRTNAKEEDFSVRAPDGIDLRGWKLRSRIQSHDWMLVFHGVSDNRTGVLGHAELLLRQGYNVVMMDSRAHGESGGNMATYGWKERHDTVAIVNGLYSSEKVCHLGALGVSMGAAIALQSAAVESRIQGVIAEDPFANLREVSYDYAGLHLSPLLGETLFLPATIFAMKEMEKTGGFPPDDVSPEHAVASRPFSILLICGTRDHIIPCRHAESIYDRAIGPRELWIVQGAEHALALGQAPAEYEYRVARFLGKTFDVH